jgi:hypothetical protein
MIRGAMSEILKMLPELPWRRDCFGFNGDEGTTQCRNGIMERPDVNNSNRLIMMFLSKKVSCFIVFLHNKNFFPSTFKTWYIINQSGRSLIRINIPIGGPTICFREMLSFLCPSGTCDSFFHTWGNKLCILAKSTPISSILRNYAHYSLGKGLTKWSIDDDSQIRWRPRSTIYVKDSDFFPLLLLITSRKAFKNMASQCHVMFNYNR